MSNKTRYNNWDKSIIAILSIVIISIPIGIISINAETNSEYTEMDNFTSIFRGTRGTRGTILVPDDYPSIQQAIDNASTGDTILVAASTYYENLYINKTITLIGDDKETTIIDGGNNGDVVYIHADYVNVSGFKITNSGKEWLDYVITIMQVSNCNISDCIITNNYRGIRIAGTLYRTGFNIIANNEIFLITDNQLNNAMLE